jgi:hypothetical protein
MTGISQGKARRVIYKFKENLSVSQCFLCGLGGYVIGRSVEKAIPAFMKGKYLLEKSNFFPRVFDDIYLIDDTEIHIFSV